MNGREIVRSLSITLRNAQVRRISWVRGVRPARERCEWPPHIAASARPPITGTIKSSAIGGWSRQPAPVDPLEPGIRFQRSLRWTKRGLIKVEGQYLRRSHAACERFICSFRRITPGMPKSSFLARSNRSKLSRLSRSQRHIAYAAEPKLSEVRTTVDTAQNDQGAASRRRPIRVRVSRLQSHLRDERPHPIHRPARSLARPGLATAIDGLRRLVPIPEDGRAEFGTRREEH